MASITITVPDDKVTAVLDAFAARHGRPDQIVDPLWVDPEDGTPEDLITNPETKAAFAKRMVAEHIRKVYVDRKKDEANVVKASSVSQAESDIMGVE